jgi:hypothetical protein
MTLSYGSFVCYVTGTIIASGTPAIALDLHVNKALATYVLTTPVIGERRNGTERNPSVLACAYE